MKFDYVRPVVFALVLVGAGSGPPALAGTLLTLSPSFTEASDLITVAPDYPAVNSAPFLTPPGTGYDGVALLLIHRTDGDYYCTGALIAPTLLLTAAHCLSNTAGLMITTRVDASFYPEGGATVVVTATSGFLVDPNYNGAVISDYDIALVRLPTSPGSWANVYGLYEGVVTGDQYTVVGFGRRGDGATGTNPSASGSRRQGFNTFDFFYMPGVLISDFDSGLALNDVSCYYCVVCDLGLGSIESSTAPGDSGGPVFFGNQIVAITTFGATFGASLAGRGCRRQTEFQLRGIQRLHLCRLQPRLARRLHARTVALSASGSCSGRHVGRGAEAARGPQVHRAERPYRQLAGGMSIGNEELKETDIPAQDAGLRAIGRFAETFEPAAYWRDAWGANYSGWIST